MDLVEMLIRSQGSQNISELGRQFGLDEAQTRAALEQLALVIAAGASESGATIHAVDEIYDHGPVIERRTVPVLGGDTAEALEARVAAMEPGFFVETLARIAAGELRLPD